MRDRGHQDVCAALGAAIRTRRTELRLWVARASKDKCFRAMCDSWLKQKDRSANFQLHPPLNTESNTFRNECGDLQFPLLFRADWHASRKSYELVTFEPEVLENGACCADHFERKEFAKLFQLGIGVIKAANRVKPLAKVRQRNIELAV